MIEHLSNCHGEMSLLLLLLGGIPFLGPTIKRFLRSRSAKQLTHTHK